MSGSKSGSGQEMFCTGKAAETGIDPGKSKAAYIAEKALGGAATSVEGTYNNILDNARAQVNAQLTNGYVTDTGVNLRDMQNFWAAVFGGKHAQYAQDTQAADKAVAEQLPAAADRLRSTKAAEYAQGLDEKYGATGLWKVGGDLAAGVGGYVAKHRRECCDGRHAGAALYHVLRRRKRGGPGAGLWRGRGHGAGVRPAFGRDGGRDRENRGRHSRPWRRLDGQSHPACCGQQRGTEGRETAGGRFR